LKIKIEIEKKSEKGRYEKEKLNKRK